MLINNPHLVRPTDLPANVLMDGALVSDSVLEPEGIQRRGGGIIPDVEPRRLPLNNNGLPDPLPQRRLLTPNARQPR